MIQKFLKYSAVTVLLVASLLILLFAVFPTRSNVFSIFSLDGIDRAIDRYLTADYEDFSVGGQYYRMPKEYVRTLQEGNEKRDVVINLRYIWPNFLPERLAKPDELLAARENNNIGSLYLSSNIESNRKKRMNKVPISRQITKVEDSGYFGSFKKYTLYEDTHDKKSLKVSGESYVLEGGSDVTDVIFCFPSISKYSDRCELYFINDGFFYIVSFAKEKHLLDWSLWKQKNIEFVKQFKIEN